WLTTIGPTRAPVNDWQLRANENCPPPSRIRAAEQCGCSLARMDSLPAITNWWRKVLASPARARATMATGAIADSSVHPTGDDVGMAVGRQAGCRCCHGDRGPAPRALSRGKAGPPYMHGGEVGAA